MKKYSVARDAYGYAIAIVKDGSYFLHLDRGTKLNEKNIDQVVAILNGAVSDEPTDEDVFNSRLNKIALEMDGLDNPERWRKLNEEYMETYAKLVQLRRDK